MRKRADTTLGQRVKTLAPAVEKAKSGQKKLQLQDELKTPMERSDSRDCDRS